jgi:YidC/Oxa1 family membrane protein insertase
MGKMINNNVDKQDTKKRILVATVISLFFFIIYDFMYLQPELKKQEEQKKIEEQAKQNRNNTVVDDNVAPSTNSAPTMTSQSTTTNAAPPVKNTTNANILSTIKTANSIIQIDSLGRIAQVTLTNKRYENNEHTGGIKLFTNSQLRPLEVRFSNGDLNTQSFKTKVEVSSNTIDASKTAQKLVITQTLSSTVLTKTLTFYPKGHYDLDIQTNNEQTFFVTPGFRPDVIADVYADHGALYVNNDGTINIIEDQDLDKNANFVGVRAVSAFDRYYATVLYNFDKNHQVSVMKNGDDSPESFIHITNGAKLHGYMGPKEYKVLEDLHPDLTQVIEYGWFTFIAKPMFSMMQFIQDYTGNWGWTIVLVTLLVKLVLFPLAHKGMVSMNKLKELAPKIKAIQEKYKDDKQKASTHMMELYKKEGANPMGGCLPIILQIPVFFAVYRVLVNAIELKGSEWILWFDDLTHTIAFPNLLDPYIVLPLLMGLTMYIQQQITPTQIQDEMQKKIFQWLPVMFTIFFIFFPAGLILYWTVNNIFTIVQQYYINRTFAKNKELRHEEHLAKKQKK